MTKPIQASKSTSRSWVSIMIVVVLIDCALFHPMCGLKAVQINVQCSLIQTHFFKV